MWDSPPPCNPPSRARVLEFPRQPRDSRDPQSQIAFQRFSTRNPTCQAPRRSMRGDGGSLASMIPMRVPQKRTTLGDLHHCAALSLRGTLRGKHIGEV